MELSRNVRKPGFERFLKFVRSIPEPSPREMFTMLAEHGYRGQVEARQALCLMAYRHVRRIKRLYIEGAERQTLARKSNYLLIGPTGCGKTFLVETLFGKILKLPTAMVDITTYSETGYVGQDPSTILTRLLHVADENPLMASIGIICLDEFDKISSGQNNAVFAGAGTTKDVTGMGVQRELLKMLESSEVIVPLELSHNAYGDHVILSTADIGFVAAGAFSGFQHIARRRARRDNIGFARPCEERISSTRANLRPEDALGNGTSDDAAYHTSARLNAPRTGKVDDIAVHLSIDDVESIANFQSYGFLPELIARFTRIVPFDALDTETLREILDIDVVQRMQREFGHEGFELTIDSEVLDFVVEHALRRQTGARGLASALTRQLEEVAFYAFGHADGGIVRVQLHDNQIDVQFET